MRVSYAVDFYKLFRATRSGERAAREGRFAAFGERDAPRGGVWRRLARHEVAPHLNQRAGDSVSAQHTQGIIAGVAFRNAAKV
jgi:hypothetical protein